MPIITYPSALTPAPPRVRVDVPDGWEQLTLDQTLLAARETGGPEDTFATNVTVRHLVRGATLTDEQLIDELRDYASGQDQGVVSSPFAEVVNGTEVRGANLSYVDPVAGTLGQIHVFARHPDSLRTSVVQLVASFSGGRAAELRPVLRAIVTSLQIEWPAREPKVPLGSNPS